MLNRKNVHYEIELYEPMRSWLHHYLQNKYNGCRIITLDSHAERLDRALAKYGICIDLAIGVDIQIDVLGIVQKQNEIKIFFIEAKKTALTLRDLGQLWAYCKLIDPEEAFLFTSMNLGSLDKLLNIFLREDLLDFGKGKVIKKMKVGVWDISSNAPDMFSLIPKL
jgi:hypothetical protein